MRCVEEGVEAALRPRPSRQLHPRKLDGIQEAHLVALACCPSPKGRNRWSLRLLADKLVELESWTTSRTKRCGGRLKNELKPLKTRNGSSCRPRAWRLAVAGLRGHACAPARPGRVGT